MKPLIFTDFESTMRHNIVTFSPLYQSMVKEIKAKLLGQTVIDLCLCRIDDTGVSITTPATQFFNVTTCGENMLTANYYDSHCGEGHERIPIKKTIRFDNPFGEIAILPSEEIPELFLIGEQLESYRVFIHEVKCGLLAEIGNNVQLRYKNDDGTFSVLHGVLREVNKGNIFMDDYHEFLVKNDESLSAKPLLDRKKNHRFISEKGYLCGIHPALISPMHMHGDNETLDQSVKWHFLADKIA